MSRCRVSTSPLLAWIVLFMCIAPGPELRAQDLDSSSTSTQFTVDGELVDALPIDRARDALSFLPGITTDNAGELLLRGGHPGDASVYLDGVPILSGFRSTPFFALSISRSLESQAAVGPNLVDSISVVTGPLPAQWGNGQAGVISIRTRDPGRGIGGKLAYESDEPFGSGHSFGLNRVEGNIEGTTGGFGFLLGGLLQGQRSVERGFESEQNPIFVIAGLDTVVAVPSSLGDPFADTTMVEVQDFAVSRGSCDDFGASSNAEIAANYQVDCAGAHTPFSPVSTYDLLGKLTYGQGRTRLTLLGLADQHQNRNFDYGTLYNPVEATGNRTSSTMLMVGWSQQLNRTAERPLLLDAHLSFQSDRERSGPLAPEGLESTADPFGGFLLSPLDLRFDFDNFPVNDELINNYRTNQVGSRRSPYDLENPAQYSTVDRWRNNAYGLYNRDFIAPTVFTEQGGPVGLLTLYKENRALAATTLSWKPSSAQLIRLGGEFTRYSIDTYVHLLESSDLSDVYSEHPIRGAVFLQDQLTLGAAAITAGVRYDFFSTRARRPRDFPRISTHPLFDPTDPDAFFTNDSLFPQDDSHARLSPRIQAAFRAAPGTVFRGGVATQAQVPDLRRSLLRVNTDVALVNPSVTVFGSDLDFERTTTYELGVTHTLGQNLDLDLSVYSRNVESQVGISLEPRFDPLRGNTQNLLFLNDGGSERVRGGDVLLRGRLGSTITGWLGYSYQDASSEQAVAIGREARVPTLLSRPHSLTGAVALNLPADWKRGSALGAVLSDLGVYTTFRFASGTPYTQCRPRFAEEESVLSPNLCSVPLFDELNQSRLPVFKMVDLRVIKRFGPQHRFAAYLDARNILNFKNVLAVFAATGEPTNPAEIQMNWSADSADLSSEAEANGAYNPAGSISLGPALPDPRVSCTTWIDQSGNPAAPNCVYLIRAEERFGNGDHLFDLTEQRRASESLYHAVRGTQEFTGPPRRMRLGLEVGF